MKTETQKQHPLQLFIDQNCENVQRMEKQLTTEECEKLYSKFPDVLIKDKLMNMENLKGLHKKYISVYLTLNNWCNR